MKNPIRKFIFHHYWIITIVAVIVGGLAILQFSKAENVPSHFVTLCASALGIAFLVQKQALDELQLFERLFTHFNARYDEMHKELMLASDGQIDENRTRRAFDKYFNLCAEEYLFYKEGYIHPDAWQSWYKGMQSVINKKPAADYWFGLDNRGGEQDSKSHYGLTIERKRLIQS